MEVRIKVDALVNGTLEPHVVAFFTMVARDAKTGGAANVNLLSPQTEEEKLLYEQGTENAQRRKIAAQQSLLVSPPNDEERQIVHKLFLETKQRDHGLPPIISPY